MGTYAEWQYWLKTILSEGSDKLNDWESCFIENIETRLNGGEDLTSK